MKPLGSLRSASVWTWVALASVASLSAIGWARDWGIGRQNFWMGVAPNFVGVFTLTFFWMSWKIPRKSSDTTRAPKVFYQGCLGSTGGLVLWEFIQLKGNLVFDPYDIVATMVGTLACWAVFALSFHRRPFL